LRKKTHLANPVATSHEVKKKAKVKYVNMTQQLKRKDSFVTGNMPVKTN